MEFRYFLDKKIDEYFKEDSEYQNLKTKFEYADKKLEEYKDLYNRAYLIDADIDEYGGIEYYYLSESDFKKIANRIELSYQTIEENKKFIEETQVEIKELIAKKTFLKSTAKEKDDKIKTLEKLINDKSTKNYHLEQQIKRDKETLEDKKNLDEYVSKEQIDFDKLREQRNDLLEALNKIKLANVIKVILKNLDAKEINDIIDEAIKNEGNYDRDYDAKYYIFANPNSTISIAYKFIYGEAKKVLENNHVDLVQQFKDNVGIEKV